MPIQLLDDAVAAQIAAGEVVERPASVVKELLENALDAGAQRISVEIAGGGLREIRVRDDGCGIAADEVELAFMRHATSKLRVADDLWNIHTLGFRGEALPSIASVSQLICVTRNAAADVGCEVRIAGGELQAVQPIGAPRGTDIRVRQLFYNAPVRREYLRSESNEVAAIAAIVQQYALAYPEVRLSLAVDGRTTVQTNGDGDLRAAVLACYGIETARGLLPVELESGVDEQHVRVSGLIAPPGLTRSTRAQMTLFANRRALQPRGALVSVIEQAYHTLLMKGRFPLVVLNLAVHPASIDVNVHPTKSEVKFRFATQVHGVLGRAIRSALVTGAGVASWQDLQADPNALQRQAELRRIGQQPPTPTPGAWGVGRSAWDAERSRWDSGAAPTSTPLAAALAAGAEDQAAAATAPLAPGREPPTLPPPVSSSAGLPPLRIIGQVGLTYIVAESPEGMLLIDQHAAHERITYERLMAQYAEQAVETQQLLLPLTVALSAAAQTLLLARSTELARWGFAIEPWDGGVRLRSIPATLPADQAAHAIHELVEERTARGDSMTEHREAALITLACHTSVRAGQALSHDEMRGLVRQLEACISPRTCPHGRPTMIVLTPAQLEKQFGRRV